MLTNSILINLKNGTTSSKNVKSLAKILNGRGLMITISPNVLIMVDEEGKLADSSSAVIKTAIEQHKKWVELAAEIGCHSIRVNLSGEKGPQCLDRKIRRGIDWLVRVCKKP